MRCEVIWCSDPVKIGKHEWRVRVVPSRYLGRRCTEYQFRGPNAERRYGYSIGWCPDEYWPTYNHNDGTYAGLPKSLAKRLWYPNRSKIESLLCE